MTSEDWFQVREMVLKRIDLVKMEGGAGTV